MYTFKCCLFLLNISDHVPICSWKYCMLFWFFSSRLACWVPLALRYGVSSGFFGRYFPKASIFFEILGPLLFTHNYSVSQLKIYILRVIFTRFSLSFSSFGNFVFVIFPIFPSSKLSFFPFLCKHNWYHNRTHYTF